MTAGQTRRAERRARRKERRGGRKETRQERRAARRAKRADRGWGQAAAAEVRSKIDEWRDGDEGAAEAAENGPQISTPVRIPGPGPQGAGWGGTPAAPGTVATTNGGETGAAGWWMDPKILILGAAALFILMRKK